MYAAHTEQGRRPRRLPGPVSHQVIAWAVFGAGAAMASSAALAQTPAPVQVPAVTVTAPPPTDGYKTDYVQSPKYTAPLLDTPKSITVIPQELIQDRGATSLQDVLRTVPGITLGSGEGGNPIGDRPFIRGFDSMTDTFVDGVRDVGSQQRETFNIEQVEVSKGPGSAYTGRGSTGGSLNLVTKTPKMENFTAGSITLGTDQTKRITADGNYMLSDYAAVRLNVMGHDANVAERKEVNQNRWGVAPSLALGLNGPTRAIFSYYHLQTDDLPDYGLPYDPRTGQPVKVNRRNFYGLTDRDFQNTQIDVGTIRLEHDFSDNMTLRNTTRYGWSTNDYIVTNPDDSKGNVVNGLVWRGPKSRNSDTTSMVNQTDLSGSFHLGGMKHSYSTGVEFSREKVRNRNYAVGAGNNNCAIEGFANFNCTSLFNPTPNDPWSGSVAPSTSWTHTTTDTASVYAFDTIELTDKWSITGGLRFDSYRTKAVGSSGRFSNDSNLVNYMIGVVYKPVPEASIYFSHGTSSNPSGQDAGEGSQSINANNQSLEPEKNRSFELGAKWDVFDRKLSLTGAVFRIEKTNARVNDPLGGTQLLVGEQRVNGFELGASGSITKEWKVFAGYTFLDSEIVDGGPAGTNEGKAFPNTPRHSASLWTTYQILPRLTIGGGAFYMSKRYGSPDNTKSVPSYWRFDAMASYDLTDNVELRLNVQNLTNKLYFDKPYTTHFATVAPGRVAMLTANVKF